MTAPVELSAGTGVCATFICIKGRTVVLYWALVFLVVAIVAGVFGFGGVAATAAGIAKIIFFVFLVVFLVTLVMGLVQGRRPSI